MNVARVHVCDGIHLGRHDALTRADDVTAIQAKLRPRGDVHGRLMSIDRQAAPLRRALTKERHVGHHRSGGAAVVRSRSPQGWVFLAHDEDFLAVTDA